MSEVADEVIARMLSSCMSEPDPKKLLPDKRPRECIHCFSTDISTFNDGWAFQCTCRACGLGWEEKLVRPWQII